MRRRDFIKKTSQAVALAAVTGGTGLLFHNRETARANAPLVKGADFGVAPDKTMPQIVLARQTDPLNALNSALDGIGGIGRFISPGDRVTVKPNVGWDRRPEQAANTNPLLVGEMVRLCLAAGAGEVIVTDYSCNDPRRCFIRSGIGEAAEKAGARVILPQEKDFLNTNLDGEVLTVWPVLKYMVQTDRLINMPIVKQHSLCSCTIGMKNLYGILGGRRNQLHQQIDQSIVDLADFCRPTLTVVDATRVLLRGGPTGGSLDDVAREDSVICATDPVAADARAAEFLGLRADQVSHLVLAERSGLGKIAYREAGYKEIA
ncbi:MAG: DUF362 domain-containing protein [candidate division Zixibacteria bacterium]|nr:DUF362 domain-containing protein [candidate division Zixibacteria bacterium]